MFIRQAFALTVEELIVSIVNGVRGDFCEHKVDSIVLAWRNNIPKLQISPSFVGRLAGCSGSSGSLSGGANRAFIFVRVVYPFISMICPTPKSVIFGMRRWSNNTLSYDKVEINR